MSDLMLNYPTSLFDRLDRLQRELSGAFGVEGTPSSIRSVAAGSYPAINVGRTASAIEVHAYAPGLDAGKIDVTVDRGVLHLSGERLPQVPTSDNRVHVYTRERVVGRFSRALSLPEDADPAKVEARYRDGVLQVTIGLRETARPQRINVQ